ncbi:DUF2269 family protein [Paenibacillus flagellatus]|uniref:DUF2269 domain-containing protein n=1 Tax=Paenibacillus flagellatus TaxID=2211139 RepID=A0A2V5JZ28_9BACL|nr:DUF2269 family protein [Paenibacillus flagellatus]PYI51542.1 hypothetical protein DLM86_24295 [Paenibacillus flagellatus]
MFGLLLVLHILSAIAFMGSAFLIPAVRRSAKTAGQLRFVFDMTAKLSWFSKIGGAVLIATGIGLMLLTGMGLSQMWLNASILLSLLLAVAIGACIEPRLNKLAKLVAASRGDEVPAELSSAMKKIVPLESAAQLLMIAVIVLMVIKPF